MKILLWILNITNRHRADIRRYQNGGVATRIFIILVSILFSGLTAASEFLFLNLFYKSGEEPLFWFFCILGAALLAIALLLATLDFCICFSYVGFKMSFVGAVFTGVSLIDKARGNKPSKASSNYNYRWFDLIIGFFELALAVGLIALCIYLLLKYPEF